MAVEGVPFLVILVIPLILSGESPDVINTHGCQIPNFHLRFQESKTKVNCGVRDVFIRKVPELKNTIQFTITTKYDVCCYRFISLSNKTEYKINYSKCQLFNNKELVKLESDLINIRCRTQGIVVYEDVYALTRTLEPDVATKPKKNIDKKNATYPLYNVLVIGMDSMSRQRAYSSMESTVDYFKRNEWLDFKGYNKFGPNPVESIMSILTGTTESVMKYENCSKWSDCKNKFIWHKFHKKGYVTAYGDDSVYINNTTPHKNNLKFSNAPVDHYLNPLFMATEKKLKGDSICVKNKHSGLMILDYITSLANTYKNNRKYFGYFWIHSFSHGGDQSPKRFDEDMKNFFEKMQESGLLEDTFVVFLSNTGISNGAMRYPMEGFYDERLPMLFMHVPSAFKQTYRLSNMQYNQYRLISPFDVYLTIWDMLKVSTNSKMLPKLNICPKCMSLFEYIPGIRKCADAGVSVEWCTCHNMTKNSFTEFGAMYSLRIGLTRLNNISSTVETRICTKCKNHFSRGIMRINNFIVKNQFNGTKYYVAAFDVNSGGTKYEAIVRQGKREYDSFDYDVVWLKLLSDNGSLGSCTVHKYDQDFCTCEKMKTFECFNSFNKTMHQKRYLLPSSHHRRKSMALMALLQNDMKLIYRH